MVLDEANIERVDKFGEKVRDRLQAIGESGDWGAKFAISQPPVSDYYRAPVLVGGEPIRKNWLQLNGHTYFHPSYSSPRPWKLQARFASPPDSPLWEKKTPYVHNRQPQEWSLGGLDVWAISYEKLAEALSEEKEDDIMDEILRDLALSWAYTNGQELPQDSASSRQSDDRVEVTLSISSSVWSEFQRVYSQQYRSRRKHPRRPSYARLRDDAVDVALMEYVTRRQKLRQSETEEDTRLQ